MENDVKIYIPGSYSRHVNERAYRVTDDSDMRIYSIRTDGNAALEAVVVPVEKPEKKPQNYEALNLHTSSVKFALRLIVALALVLTIVTAGCVVFSQTRTNAKEINNLKKVQEQTYSHYCDVSTKVRSVITAEEVDSFAREQLGYVKLAEENVIASSSGSSNAVVHE